jgi:hypothetical protein
MRGLAGIAVTALAVTALAGSAAAGIFDVPEGCRAELTVQSRSCLVSHYWSCPQDRGHRWRIDFGSDGARFLSRIDAEAQWIESGAPDAARRTVTLLPAEDPGSVTELLETGLDSYDFLQRRPDGRVERIVGFDRIAGAAVEIDGEVLLPTEFNASFRDLDGKVLLDLRGREYVSARFRRFFGGISQSIDGGRVTELDRTPVEFIEPGEEGFLSTQPQHDCEVLSGSPLRMGWLG